MISVREATLSDLPAVVPCMTRRSFAHLSFQLNHSAALAVELENKVVAVGGIYQQTDHFELWFLAARDLRGRREANAIMRLLRRALHSIPEDQQVFAYVARGHEAGLRLCKCFGFAEAWGEDDSPYIRLRLVARKNRLA